LLEEVGFIDVVNMGIGKETEHLQGVWKLETEGKKSAEYQAEFKEGRKKVISRIGRTINR